MPGAPGTAMRVRGGRDGEKVNVGQLAAAEPLAPLPAVARHHREPGDAGAVVRDSAGRGCRHPRPARGGSAPVTDFGSVPSAFRQIHVTVSKRTSRLWRSAAQELTCRGVGARWGQRYAKLFRVETDAAQGGGNHVIDTCRFSCGITRFEERFRACDGYRHTCYLALKVTRGSERVS
jgi:hypothetical protein